MIDEIPAHRRFGRQLPRISAPRLDRNAFKRAAAEQAVAEVVDGMVVELGSGSSASFAIAARVAAGLRVVGIPTSQRAAAFARRLGVPLSSFAEHRRIDLTIDGADWVERRTLTLAKASAAHCCARRSWRAPAGGCLS